MGERVNPAKVPWRYLVFGGKGAGKSTLISMMCETYRPKDKRLIVHPLRLQPEPRVDRSEAISNNSMADAIPSNYQTFCGIVHDPERGSFPGTLRSDGKSPETYPSLIVDAGCQHASLDLGARPPSLPQTKTRTGKNVQFVEVPSFSREEIAAREVLSKALGDQCSKSDPSTENTKKWYDDIESLIKSKREEIQSAAIDEESGERTVMASDEESEGTHNEDSTDSSSSSSSSGGDFGRFAVRDKTLDLFVQLDKLDFDPNDTIQDGQPVFAPGVCGMIYVFRSNVLFEDCVETERQVRTMFEAFVLWEESTCGIARVKTERQREKFLKELDDLLVEKFRLRLWYKIMQATNEIQNLIQIPSLKGLPLHIVFNHQSEVNVSCSKNPAELRGSVGDEFLWNDLFLRTLKKTFDRIASPIQMYEAFKVDSLYTSIHGNVKVPNVEGSDGFALRKNKNSKFPVIYSSRLGNVYGFWNRYVCEHANLLHKEPASKGPIGRHNTKRALHSLTHLPRRMSEFEEALTFSDKLAVTFFPLDGCKFESEPILPDPRSLRNQEQLETSLRTFGRLKTEHTFPLYQEGLFQCTKQYYIRTDHFQETNETTKPVPDVTENRYTNLLGFLCLTWDWLIIHGRNYDKNCARKGEVNAFTQ